MAAIYTVGNDELRIYHNRFPKKNGGEPWLLFLLFLVPWTLLRLGGLAFFAFTALLIDGAWEMMLQDNEFLPIFGIVDFSVTVCLMLVVCSQFTSIVFSPVKGEVYWKLLFFRRHLAWFSEIADVRPESRKALGIFTRHSFSAVRKKGAGKKPFRISPTAGKTPRLSMYYHYVAPIANDMLQRSRAEGKGGEASAEAVYGEAVEVPAGEAEKYLGGDSVGA